MLGRYENFPQVIHGRARFKCQGPVREVQRAILCSFHRLNRKIFRLNVIASHLSPECEVGFEFGIAQDMVFNYLDKQELNRFEKCVVKKELPIMDFFCAVHYHAVNKKGKRVPLKFDYHLIRFTFHGKGVEFCVSHERGPQHVPLQDFINFITSHINEKLSKEESKPLDLEYLRTL